MALSYLALAGLAVAFGVTVSVTPVVARIALSRGWTDRPDGRRKLHMAATPSVGGVAIAAGVAAGLTLIGWTAPRLSLPGTGLHPLVFAGAALMALTGVIDDVRGLGFKAKFFVEVVVAGMFVSAGYAFDLSGLAAAAGHDVLISGVEAVLSILWIVAVTNAVNLIDGVDGLAAGVVAVAFASMAAVFGLSGDLGLAVVGVVFVGGLTGFLVHNFSPASIFMGDSGSLFLGGSLAAYTLSAPASADPLLAIAVPALAIGLPLLDTLLSVVRRTVGKRGIFAADRDHIHHRMADRMPTRRAVAVLYSVSAMFGVLAVVGSLSAWTGGTAAVAAASLVAAVLLLRLGYVRLPYAPPSFQPILVPADGDARPAVQPAGGGPPGDTGEESPAEGANGILSEETGGRHDPPPSYRVGTA